MGARIAVGSWTLGAGFSGLTYRQLCKQLKAGQTVVEAMIPARTPEFQEARWLGLLADPRPDALIGICCRPGPG